MCCSLQWSKHCCAQNGNSHTNEDSTTDCNVIHTNEDVTTHCDGIQLLDCGGKGWRDGSAFKITYCSGRMQKTWIHSPAPTGHLTTTSNSISKVPNCPLLTLVVSCLHMVHIQMCTRAHTNEHILLKMLRNQVGGTYL